MITKIPRMGRPPKWETPEELQELIDGYFESCVKPKFKKIVRLEANEKRVTDLREEDYEWEAVLDPGGEPVYENVRPLTITGLAVALGTSRENLLNYEKNQDFFDTIKKAKDIIHNWTEESLYDTGNGQAVGKIFNLKNNWGWVDKSEIDVKKKITDVSKEDVDEEVDTILGKNNLKKDEQD